MKKLLSIACCVLYAHSFSKVPMESTTSRTSDAKVLIKAIAVMMNPEGNKKTPIKTVNIFSSESF
ncbi:MAG TPA: hypothetical protein VEV87_05805 [Chitinophagaceae bacterium]|nr:hypothetical protein [Chitinophagaceae bacterium]